MNLHRKATGIKKEVRFERECRKCRSFANARYRHGLKNVEEGITFMTMMDKLKAPKNGWTLGMTDSVIAVIKGVGRDN